MTLSPDFSRKPSHLSTISWILYDLANTAYSMNIVSLYFGTWIIIDLAQSDVYVSLVNALSMLLVAFTMPVLGDWSDIRQKKFRHFYYLQLFVSPAQQLWVFSA